MKKFRFFLLAISMILCAGIIAFTASAETPLSAKQLFLDKLQSYGLNAENDLAKTSSGTTSYRIKALDGILASSIEPVKSLAGAELKLDYKLNSPQKKFEANYNLAWDKNNYQGSMFMDNDKLIFTTEFVSLIKQFDPGFDLGKEEIPPYFYISDQNLNKSWENTVKGQYIPPELKDLLIFVLEAVPDKYFTVSLADQKIIFQIDRNGFEETMLAVMQKVKGERERFAELIANLAVAFDPSQDGGEIKKEFLESLEESINSGDYPDSPGKIRKLLDGKFVLNELKYEASLLPSGKSSLILNAGFGGSREFGGEVSLKTEFTGGKENLEGAYVLDLTARDNNQKIRIDGQISGEFKQTSSDARSSGLIKADVKDLNGNVTLLQFEIQSDSESRVDRNVVVKVPVLNESNSINFEKPDEFYHPLPFPGEQVRDVRSVGDNFIL